MMEDKSLTQYSKQPGIVPQNMNELALFARHMARSNIVPKHLQGNEGACFLIAQRAVEWGMSPLAVAECTSEIHGRLCYEGKLVAAVIYNSGILSGRLRYEYTGTGANRKCTVFGKIRGEEKERSVEVELSKVRTTTNKNWTNDPDQQMAYYGNRKWARLHSPEVLSGVIMEDEVEEIDMGRAVVVEPGTDTLDALADQMEEEKKPEKAKESLPKEPEEPTQAELERQFEQWALLVQNDIEQHIEPMFEYDYLEAWRECVGEVTPTIIQAIEKNPEACIKRFLEKQGVKQ
jgi:hypothetical protein